MTLKSKTILLVLFLFSAALLLQSCKEDDNAPRNPTAVFPRILTFSQIEDTEFLMWTDGAEVSTTGLFVGDFITPLQYSYLTSEYYASLPGIVFTADSIFIEHFDGIASFEYAVRNDSIFMYWISVLGQDSMDVTDFYAEGNAFGFTRNIGYCRFIAQDGSTYFSRLRQGHFDFSSAMESAGQSTDVSDIGPGDTLIVYNQRVRYD